MPTSAVNVGPPDTLDIDILVNATSLGMQETDPLPIAETMLRPGLLAAEIIMRPEETAFLRVAKKQGATLQYGRHMLEEQKGLMADFLQMEQAPFRS